MSSYLGSSFCNIQAKTNPCLLLMLAVCSIMQSYNIHTNTLTFISVMHFSNCSVLVKRKRVNREEHDKQVTYTESSQADKRH